MICVELFATGEFFCRGKKQRVRVFAGALDYAVMKKEYIAKVCKQNWNCSSFRQKVENLLKNFEKNPDLLNPLQFWFVIHTLIQKWLWSNPTASHFFNLRGPHGKGAAQMAVSAELTSPNGSPYMEGQSPEQSTKSSTCFIQEISRLWMKFGCNETSRIIWIVSQLLTFFLFPQAGWVLLHGTSGLLTTSKSSMLVLHCNIQSLTVPSHFWTCDGIS